MEDSATWIQAMDGLVLVPEQPEVGPAYPERLARFLADEGQVDDEGGDV